MPVFYKDSLVAGKVAREAERFAGLVRKLPRDPDARPHPELAQVLASFQRINGALAKGNRADLVGGQHQATIAREFQKIGEALSASAKAARSSRAKR